MRQTLSLLLSLAIALSCFSQVNLNQGLLAYYPFNGNANDASGNGNNGILQNGVSFVPDKNNNPNSAVHFDGINDFIQVANNGTLSPRSGFSFVLQFKTEDAVSVQTLLARRKMTDQTQAQFQAFINWNAYPGFGYAHDYTNNSACNNVINLYNQYVKTGTNTINPNQWYCVVGTFDGVYQKIYLNGVLMQNAATPLPLMDSCENVPMTIGKYTDPDPQWFKGTMDEVRIYNRALNQNEVDALCLSNTSTGNICTGQPFFQKTYGGNSDEAGYSIVATPDSGYVIGGFTKSFGNGGSDGLFLKTDKNGDVIWNKAVGGTGDDLILSMSSTSDNGFIAAGQTKSYGNPAGDLWLVKLDATGNVQWSKKYGDGNIYGEIGYGVIQLSDGGYAVCGTHKFSAVVAESFVVRTDNQGNVLWSKQYGNSNSDEAYGLCEDGNFLMIAGIYYGNSYYDGYVMRLDKSNGSLQWIKGYDLENRSTRIARISKTNSGFQAFAVVSDDFVETNEQTAVFNLNPDGTVQNVRKTVIPGIKTIGVGWYPLTDGGFIISNSENNNNADILLAKVNAGGTLDWSKKFPLSGKQYINTSITPSPEGGWAATGVNNNVESVADSNNILLIKVDNLGNIAGCSGVSTNDLTLVIPSYQTPTPNVVALGDVAINNPIISPGVISASPNIVTYCYSCQDVPQIINSYTPVIGLNSCDNKMTVEDATSFNVGDTILMIQMKGAVVDSSNTATFGTVSDYKNAGNYEFNYVKSKSGNIIELKNKLIRQYDLPDGKVQCVRVPYFQNAVINSTLTCLPWDGSKGGVLVLNVADSIVLNADIDVSGKGFRGGNDPFTNPASYYCSENQFYYPPNPDLASEKGESIAIISSSKSFGKGHLANGGGSGNSHNSGGGGGSNGAVGGLGGYQYEGTPCDVTVPFDNRGIGGIALTYTNAANKIFMGGGGGAGQSNNATAFESKGGAGGGIAIILSNKIKSNQYKIRANGNDGLNCGTTGTECHEGMGGGGGGGVVLMKINNYSGNDSIEAKGGKGANMTTSGFLRLGPGGGGGGGVVWSNSASLPANVAIATNGGANGSCISYSNDPWGASTGQNGISLSNLQIPFDTAMFKTNIDSVRIKDSITNCQNYDFTGIAYTNSNPISSWQWFFGDGGTANTQNTSHNYNAGNYTVKLVATDNNGCKDSTITNIIASILSVNAGPDTTICANANTIVLQGNSFGATQFAWTPAQFLNDSTLLNPAATLTATTTFYLTASNTQGCSTKDSVTVTVRSVNAFSIDIPTSICKNDSIMLHASGGDLYSWSPGTNPNSSSILVFPQITTNYSVMITDTVCSYSGNLSTIVTVRPLPNIKASKSGDLDCSTDFIQLSATGGAQYLWSPASTLNNPNISNPTARPTAKTTYKVKGVDATGCANYDTVTVDITSFNKGEYLMPSAFTPNGDGLNDCYGIKYWGVIDELDFSIYNRWGEKVFYTKNPNGCWDGTFKGHKQDSNVFVYLIKAKTSCGEVFRKGTFVLIR